MDVEKECKTAELLTDELCRLCANTDKQLIPIFQGEGIEHNIAEQIEKYLPIISVTQKDELPLKICYQCTSTLIAWHNFFEQCRGADDRLRELLSVNVKFNQDDDSYHDCADDFHDDFEDQASFSDNPQVECVLIEHDDGDVQIPTVSDPQIPTVSDVKVPIVNDAKIPIVSDAKIPLVSDPKTPVVSDSKIPGVGDAQILKTSDNDPIDMSNDVSKSVAENLNDSRNAESVEEKWDPLTKTPQTYSATFAEDRAKLVKSKKLGPLMRKCKEVDVTIFECGQCSAFFIDNDDFKNHENTHVNAELSGKPEAESLAGAKLCSRSRAISSKPIDGGETKSSGYQKMKIKIGGDVITKNIAVKKKNQIRESPSSIRSSKLTKKKITRYSSRSKDSHETEENVEKLKRKLERTKPEETGTTDEDVDYGVTKRRKKCAEPDESDANSSTKSPSPAASSCQPEVNSATCQLSRIRVANFAKGEFSDQEAAGGSIDRKLEQSKKVRLRRVPKNDDVDENADKGDEIFTCAHCLRSFRRKSNLRRHMLKLHCPTKRNAAGVSPSKWFTGYCCDVCGEGLQHRPTMMAHRDVRHSTHPEMDWVKYRTSLARVKFCAHCKRYFRSGSVFEEHNCDGGRSIDDASLAELVRSAEEARPKFACLLCNSCFRWKWDYRLHCETEHGEATAFDWATVEAADLAHLCEQCFKAYPSTHELTAHECAAELRLQQAPIDETTKQYRCKLCDHEYFWKSDYRRHMRLKHPKEHCRPTEHDTIVYACPYCADKFTLKKGILQHMRKVHKVNSDSPFVCVKCNKVFRRRDNLDRHNESHHPAVNDEEEARCILGAAEIRINGDLTYHCAVCNRNIAEPNRFIAHYRGHNSQTKFKCDLCDKQTRTQHQLNTHIKNIHLNIRNYRCDFCEKSFYTKQACEEHRRIHTGERPFSCEICGKTFIAGNALISHKRFHNDFYPHSCHLCDKKFKVRRSLVNHIRTHTGERPYECDLCAKTFNNSSQYSYHKKVTHSEDRPFTCPVCGNCFKANKFLTRHMELHNSSRTPAPPRQTKRRAAGGKESVGEDDVMTVAPPSDTVEDILAERGIKIFVSAPTIVSTAHLANVPSIVNVVSTKSTTILKGVNPVGRANIKIRDENILPEPNYSDVQSDYHQYGTKSSEICDSNPTAFMTTLEYIQVADGEYKPVISGETYVSLQPDLSHTDSSVKNITWL